MNDLMRQKKIQRNKEYINITKGQLDPGTEAMLLRGLIVDMLTEDY